MNDPTATEVGHGRAAKDHLWPWIIGVALAVVLAVNAVFIYIAVTGSDPVAPSYNAGER